MTTDLTTPVGNPLAGETFALRAYDENAFLMDWTVQPQGYIPFEHIHLNQDELFHIRTGTIRLVIDGKEHIGRAGQTLTVPKGARHIAYNDGPDVLDCLVAYRPALDHLTFYQCFAGLTRDGFIDKKGGVSIPMMGYCLSRGRMKALARPTNIPAPMFNIALKAFYLLGSVRGWGKLYEKYTKN